jgi:hypothetical protein
MFQRITGHPAFWALLFIIVIIGTFSYLKYEKQNEIAQRRQYLKKGPQFVTPKVSTDRKLESHLNDVPVTPTVQSNSPQAEKNPLETSETKKNPSGPNPNSSDQETTILSSNGITKTQARTTIAPHSTQDKVSKNLTITFFEVTEEQITQAFETALQKGASPIDFGDYRSTPLFSAADGPGWVKLKSKRIQLSINSLESRWVEGNTDPNMGFLMALSVSGVTFPFQVELEIIKIIPEDADNELIPVRYPTTVMDILPEQTKWLISLRLPRAVNKSALQILKDPIFNIYNSDPFLKMKSEFTLVFDFGS